MTLPPLVLGVALLWLPTLAHRAGRELPPREWSRLVGLALAGGAVAVEVGLVLTAAPTVLRAAGVPALAAACQRMLGPLTPGGPLIAWTAGCAAVGLALRAAWVLRCGRHTCDAARAEPWLGRHIAGPGFEIVVLPSPRPLALSVAGDPDQVLVTDGLVDLVSAEALRAIVRHEEAHLRHRHQRLLLWAGALDGALGALPLVRAGVSLFRTALERWADEDAAGTEADARVAVRDALLAVAEADIGDPSLAAFSPAAGLAERLEALDCPPPRGSGLRRWAVYSPLAGLGGAAIAATGWWAAEAHMMISMARFCRL